MPRITKSQKEAGVKPKPKPKVNTKAKTPYAKGRAEGSTPGRKKGFQVGPAHAPRDAYLGKGKFGRLTFSDGLRYNSSLSC